MVEIDRDEIGLLPRLFDHLRGRAERFVVLCDDLSFEEGAAAAKSLKSGAGGRRRRAAGKRAVCRHLQPPPPDAPQRPRRGRAGLIATAEDAEEEVTSVSDRFGLWIGFSPMDQNGLSPEGRCRPTQPNAV